MEMKTKRFDDNRQARSVQVEFGGKTHSLQPKFGGKHSPRDEKFLRLYKEVLEGKAPYHFALVETKAIKPFSDWKPKPDNVIAAASRKAFIKDINECIDKGEQLPAIHVYEENGSYIMSDDYILYDLYHETGISEIHCLIIGETTGKLTRRLQKLEPPKAPCVQVIDENGNVVANEEA